MNTRVKKTSVHDAERKSKPVWCRIHSEEAQILTLFFHRGVIPTQKPYYIWFMFFSNFYIRSFRTLMTEGYFNYVVCEFFIIDRKIYKRRTTISWINLYGYDSCIYVTNKTSQNRFRRNWVSLFVLENRVGFVIRDTK